MFPILPMLVLCLLLASGVAQAQVISLLGSSGVGALRGGKGLMAPVKPLRNAPGLFVGRAEGGMFADRPAHKPAYAEPGLTGLGGKDVLVIRALIEEAESRRDGYDAVQHGARIKPAKRPTQMTLDEIFKWIKDTPGQPHAIGRYQFIPSTLRRVVAKAKVKRSARFSANVQDRLADILLAEAGLRKFRKGELSRKGFMNNLAKIWAGFPNSTGKSHYHGHAGNKASISWARFDAVMAQIAPRQG